MAENLLEAMAGGLAGMSAEAQRKLVKTMTEATLRDDHIRPRALTLGWLIYWTWNSKHSPKGFPDVFLLHPKSGAVVIRELKMVGKKPTVEQKRWLDGFGAAGLDRGVWTPEDLFSGEIDRVLRAGVGQKRIP
ncbi:VRR-NUC domain-containing protein [Nonomuraea sp. NPDC059023]|uniref:VRR-NUC domain-containing protein n=1 Tax=unclassified Nonomuraea TaxID=2593643 RepID=UPI0036B07469